MARPAAPGESMERVPRGWGYPGRVRAGKRADGRFWARRGGDGAPYMARMVRSTSALPQIRLPPPTRVPWGTPHRRSPRAAGRAGKRGTRRAELWHQGPFSPIFRAWAPPPPPTRSSAPARRSSPSWCHGSSCWPSMLRRTRRRLPCSISNSSTPAWRAESAARDPTNRRALVS